MNTLIIVKNTTHRKYEENNVIKKFYDFFKNILSESEETVSNPLIQYSSETKSLEEFNHKNEVELVDNQKNELLDTIETNPATGLPSYGGIDVLGNPIGTDFNSSIDTSFHDLGSPFNSDFGSSFDNDFYNN